MRISSLQRFSFFFLARDKIGKWKIIFFESCTFFFNF